MKQYIHATIYHMQPFSIGNFFLIYWPEEESATTIPGKNIVEPSSNSLSVGDYCKVKHTCTVYEGQVATAGKCQ